MKTVIIRLNGIEKVKRFADKVSKYEIEMDLNSGRYVVDAKSVLGIFSLDLTKDIIMTIHGEESKDNSIESLLEDIAEFIVNKKQ